VSSVVMRTTLSQIAARSAQRTAMLLILGDGHGPGILLALSALASLAAELGLTAREREGLEHLALGMAAIAYPLGVAPS
jgi:hypothetical protein